MTFFLALYLQNPVVLLCLGGTTLISVYAARQFFMLETFQIVGATMFHFGTRTISLF
jgi:hypothetical protein